jgi:hypothetical protein
LKRIVRLHIQKLPEDVYLATSDDVQGLVARGWTIGIARDVAQSCGRHAVASN